MYYVHFPSENLFRTQLTLINVKFSDILYNSTYIVVEFFIMRKKGSKFQSWSM